MRVSLVDRDGKGRAYGEALAAAGHLVTHGRGGKALLIDADPPHEVELAEHVRVVTYQHGGVRDFNSDARWPWNSSTAGRLVWGEGQAHELAKAGCPQPTAACGFPLCETRPFEPRTPGRVLLAPNHPSGEGLMPQGQVEANSRAHDALLRVADELTVRYVRDDLRCPYGPEHLGIRCSPDVRYEPCGFGVHDAVRAVDGADLVVAGPGTLLCIAVARGVPAVAYHQVDQTGRPVTGRWRFPLSLERAFSIQEACAGHQAVERWRELYVGGDFDAGLAAAKFEEWAA